MSQPGPATLLQALGDIRCNRMVEAVLRRPWAAALAAAGLGVLAPEYLWSLLAVPAFLLLALAGYFAGHAAFVAGVRWRRPRCPSCKRVIWQALCGHCRRPAPALALLYRGWFLAHCPHCEGGLRDDDGLLAWCHACGETAPRHLLRSRGAVEIEVGVDLPEAAGGRPCQELHLAGRDAYTIVYRVTHEPDSLACVPDELLEAVTLVWVGRGVNPLVRDNLLASVPAGTRRGAALWLEGPVPAGVNARDWRAVRAGVGRPARGA